MNAGAARRWSLFACLALLALGYCLAFAVFVRDSRDFLAADRDRAAQQFSAAHLLSLPATLRFGTTSDSAGRLGSGWRAGEDDGNWSEGKVGRVFVAFRRCACEVRLTIHLGVYLSRHTAANGIEVLVDDFPLGHFEREHDNAWDAISAVVPQALADSGVIGITLRADHAQSPYREGLGEDRRILGMKLTAIDIAPVAGR